MPEEPRRSAWNAALLVILYLFLFGATLSLLHFAGRGWISSIVGGLILTGAFYTLIFLVARRR